MSAPPERKRRRRRWEPIDERQAEQRELKTRLDRISRTIATNTIPVDELCRSPSPEPRYDSRGKRVNTRYDRALEKLETERHKLCARLSQLDTTFRPPHGMRSLKCVDKLFIPKEKEGTLNFIGLILGPRGNTQKRLEKDFSCKVAIRGKGSVKDGRARGPSQPEDNEQLHVIITAEGVDAKERIDRCKKKIMDIITPRQDDDNDHKQAQLRELAQLNGTLRDQDREFRGHSGTNIPDNGRVVCAKCGDHSHPTSDCTVKTRGEGTDNAELDADWTRYLAEVDGVSSDGKGNAVAGVKDTLRHESVVNGAPHAAQPQATQPQARKTPPWLLPRAFATSMPPPPPPGDVRAMAYAHPGKAVHQSGRYGQVMNGRGGAYVAPGYGGVMPAPVFGHLSAGMPVGPGIGHVYHAESLGTGMPHGRYGYAGGYGGMQPQSQPPPPPGFPPPPPPPPPPPGAPPPPPPPPI